MVKTKAQNPRRRWICIGSVRANTRIVIAWRANGNCFWINWRGRESFCQPSEFREFEGLMAAVKNRLKLAGLKLISAACRPPRLEYQKLFVEVERTYDARIKNRQ